MGDFWSYDFMRYALISACILGPACALLGLFVTLRGMAFFSDALAHSAVTGVALGFLVQEKFSFAVDPMLCVFIFSFGLASLMTWFARRTSLAPDIVIAVSFTGSVAFGVIVISLLGKYRLLDGILFGSIYANGPTDILKQAILAAVLVLFIAGQMRGLALATLSPEMAHVQGIRSGWLHYALALLIAATVAVCLKMLGALLLSALIVIPPAAANLVSGSFRSLLVVSVVGGLLAATLGVLISWQFNVPTGPCIVLTDVLLLCLCYGWKFLPLDGLSPSRRGG